MNTQKSTARNTQEKWKVNPVYGTGNEFHLWDENGNFHDDISAGKMEQRARLIAAAPALLAALDGLLAVRDEEPPSIHDDSAHSDYCVREILAQDAARAAIAQAL